ncbi:beta-1,4-galactosyltransferase 4-like [Dendronephthya gigantea]|uniref:beta-1,4-galactosyltransferase 4-like n=1 Tax=Dendronephthya gigantea TaxID=151771 RepID=UPI00106900CA|nr:beta-1,4-galactosyltransferase 4-like [Dendronephthya gigantea]
MIMSRKRILFVWLLLFAFVVLVCMYLPYYATTSKAQNSVEHPVAKFSGHNHGQINRIVLASNTPSKPQPPTNKETPKVHLKNPTTISTTTVAAPTQPMFCKPYLLVGPVYYNKSVPRMQEVIEQLSVDFGGFVKKGGAFKPRGCIAKNKLAIIVPYRNRSEHLRIFLRHMHPIMQRQMHDYRIIVVEQAGNYSFNRATLINIGFLEALKISNFRCFVFHDVDHILENDRNDYGCPESPKLLGVSVDRFNRRWPYKRYFGGVGAFTREHFEKMNGYSNLYWGWGAEDDDAYQRIRAAGYSLTRPRSDVGRYIMLKEHHFRDKPGGNRYILLKTAAKRMYTDGLNTVQYKVLKKTEYPLYTHILAKLNEELDVTPNVTHLLSTMETPI